MKMGWLFPTCFGIGALALISSALFPAWRLLPIIQGQSFIPLHYNVYFGIDLFGAWYGIFVPPLFGLIVLIINLIVAARMAKDAMLFACLVAVLTLCIELAVLLSTFFIVLLNV